MLLPQLTRVEVTELEEATDQSRQREPWQHISTSFGPLAPVHGLEAPTIYQDNWAVKQLDFGFLARTIGRLSYPTRAQIFHTERTAKRRKMDETDIHTLKRILDDEWNEKIARAEEMSIRILNKGVYAAVSEDTSERTLHVAPILGFIAIGLEDSFAIEPVVRGKESPQGLLPENYFMFRGLYAPVVQ